MWGAPGWGKGCIGKLGLADRRGGSAERFGVGAIVDDELDGRGGVLDHERHGAFDAFALGDLVDKWADGGLVGSGIGKLLRLQGAEVAGEERHVRLVRCTGGGELEQGDGSRALLGAGLAGGTTRWSWILMVNSGVSTTLFVNVVAAAASVGPPNLKVSLEILVNVYEESSSGFNVREDEDFAVDEELHGIIIQVELGCRHDVLVAAGRCYTTLADATPTGKRNVRVRGTRTLLISGLVERVDYPVDFGFGAKAMRNEVNGRCLVVECEGSDAASGSVLLNLLHLLFELSVHVVAGELEFVHDVGVVVLDSIEIEAEVIDGDVLLRLIRDVVEECDDRLVAVAIAFFAGLDDAVIGDGDFEG